VQAIEGLFPNDYLCGFIKEHPAWFRDSEFDVKQKVVSFTLHDDKKTSFAKTAMYQAEKDVFANWSDGWVSVCDGLEKCLQIHNRRLTRAIELLNDPSIADPSEPTG
jgi:hypothetical protein